MFLNSVQFTELQHLLLDAIESLHSLLKK